MSKDKKHDVQGQSQDTNENEPKSDSEIRRKKLMVDIRSLKLLISNIECRLSTAQFKQISKKDIPIALNQSKEFNYPIDTDVAISNELFSQIGMHCKRNGNDSIFTFQSLDSGKRKNSYCIQLCNHNNEWELGRWFMPMSVNVREIFSKYPMNTRAELRLFLKECKNQVDCYNRRMLQYQELKDFMTTAGYICSIEKDFCFMIITIRLTREIDPSKTAATLIYINLYYKTNETRPSKLSVGCDFAELSDSEISELEHYFKSFKNFELKVAAEKILTSEESTSMWRKIEQDEVFEIDVNTDEDSENSLSEMLAEMNRTAKTRNKRRKTARNTKQNKNENTSVVQHEDPSQVESTSDHSDDERKKVKKRKGDTNTEKSTITSNVSRNIKTRKSFVKPSSKKNSLLKDSNENIKNYLLKSTTSDKRSKVEGKSTRLLCSTPLAGKTVAVSKITEEISEIGSESMNEHNEAVDKSERKSRRESQTRQSFDSDVSDEEHNSEQMELLKDLRNAKKNFNLRKQVAKKTVKRQIQSSKSGKKKIAKK